MDSAGVTFPPDNQIVIVGGGFSAIALAINLLRQSAGRALQLLLVDSRPRLGRGLAYGTYDDNLLLNVPAGNMSVWVDEPDDFVTYCRNLDPALSAASFLPRRIYGDYLESRLAELQNCYGNRVHWLRDRVTAVEFQSALGQAVIRTAQGRLFPARQVVLCLGHFSSRPWSVKMETIAGSAWINDPWQPAALDKVDRQRPVLLLGSGLTAIDTAFRLSASGMAAPILMTSRRGLLPQGHRASPKPPATGAFPDFLAYEPRTVRAFLHAIRIELERREQTAGNWRDLINELRPHTPAIWQAFSVAEKRRFLRHVLPYWDVHRHRLAPCAYQRLRDLLESGQAELVAGRVVACARNGSDIAVRVRERRGGRERLLSVGAVINCTGPNGDITQMDDPLLHQLQLQGLAQPDPLRLGLEVSTDYNVTTQAGQHSPWLYYLGPFLKAHYWEAIAVPELRVHAARLADILLATGRVSSAVPSDAAPHYHI